MNKNNSALNCKAYSFFEGVSSDHRIKDTYDWAYEGMQPEQQPPYTVTGPCLITGILDINIC